MSISSADCGPVIRRSPHGERGLKFERVKSAGYTPVRRSPRGERGLKWNISFCILCKCRSRSPRGERGLKSKLEGSEKQVRWVALLAESVD